MSITDRHARRQIEASCTLLTNITPRIVQGIHNAHVALDGGGDHEHREDAGIRGKGWISDPTAQQALGRIATHERILDDIETALETLRVTTALMVAWVEAHAPVKVDGERCSGGRTVDAWSRPDCTNWVAEYTRPDGTRALRADNLCDACRMRKYRHEKDQQDREHVA
jgi:hypothetical protein